MPTILIADDSMFQRFMHARVAKEEGFDVLEATNGEECLQQIRDNAPSALLLDLNMPGLSGAELLKEVREASPEARVLVITADIQQTTRQRCLDLGIEDFLNKPVEEDTLRNALRELA